MGAPTNTYNSFLELFLAQVPDDIEDPLVYQELLDIHNAIEAIITHSDENDTPNHDDLAGVTPDQHHPQLHDLNSHTDVDTVTNSLKEGQGLWYNVATNSWRNRAAFEESFPTGLGDGGELNIGGPVVLDEDFDEADDPVFSDTFDRALPAPWVGVDANTEVAIVNGELDVWRTSGTATGTAILPQADMLFLVDGKWYTFSALAVDLKTTGNVAILDSNGFDISAGNSVTDGQVSSVTVQWDATMFFFATRAVSLAPDEHVQWDNVLIEEVPALAEWRGIDAESLISIVNGAIQLVNGDASQAIVAKEFAVIAVTKYIIEITTTGPSAGGALSVGTTLGGTQVLAAAGLVPGLNVLEFTTGAETSVFLNLLTNSTTISVSRQWDDITIKGANGIEVIPGVAVLINSYTVPLAPPTAIGLQWPQLNEAITAAPSTAGSVVWFSIYNTGVPAIPPEVGGIPLNVGALHQWAQSPNPTLAKQEMFLGIAVHNGVEWKEVSNPKVINQTAETLREYIVTVQNLSTIISGGVVSEQPSFSLNQTEGVVWENNRNWHNDKSDPNREVLPASTPISFQYVTQDFGDVETPTTAIDPTRYDDGSPAPVLVPGPANAATIQKIYVDPANNYWVLWGQFVYPNFLTAQAHLAADIANSVIPFILQNSILLGYVIVEQAKTDWSTNEAVFVPAGGISGSGGGGTPITDHDNLNGITANNHHNQVHLLYGPDHSDVDTTDVLDLGDVLMYDGATWEPFDALDTFVAAGYGGVEQRTPVGISNINTTPQVLPVDTAVVTTPKAVTQDIANDGLHFGFSGVWMFNITFTMTHDESQSSRSFTLQIYNVTDVIVLQSSTVAVGRNQAGTNFSASIMVEVAGSAVDDLFVVRVVSTDTIGTVILESYQLSTSLVSQLLVIP